MKIKITYFAVLLIIMALLSNCSLNQSTTKSASSQQKKAKKDSIEMADSVKSVPYEVISAAPTLPYTVLKKGGSDANRVMFTEKFGARSLPNVTLYNSSGIRYKLGNRIGFENVSFPFKCTINCSVNFEVYKFDNRPALLNSFEIIIYEPGNWEVSFFN